MTETGTAAGDQLHRAEAHVRAARDHMLGQPPGSMLYEMSEEYGQAFYRIIEWLRLRERNEQQRVEAVLRVLEGIDRHVEAVDLRGVVDHLTDAITVGLPDDRPLASEEHGHAAPPDAKLDIEYTREARGYAFPQLPANLQSPEDEEAVKGLFRVKDAWRASGDALDALGGSWMMTAIDHAIETIRDQERKLAMVRVAVR